MPNIVLSNFLNKAVQTSNRRTVPTDIISEAIGLFENEETRSALLSLTDIQKKDLLLTETPLKKPIKILGKPNKALSLKISINNTNNLDKLIDKEKNTHYLTPVERPKNTENLFEVQYALTIHYGNGKQSNSQTIASYSEFFEISDKELQNSQIGIQSQITSPKDYKLKFAKSKCSQLFA